MKIYHNPRCRKSREGVQYLIDKRLNFEIIDYLKEGISEKNLKSILKKLNISAIELVRKNEKIWKDNFKGKELKENPNASMCFHWKSLLRQIRIVGTLQLVDKKTADDYYNTRAYESRIGAWASKQSSILKNREELLKTLDDFKKKYNDKDNVPRPDYWSGWNLKPKSIEFWLDGDNRIHERLKYILKNDNTWDKNILSP